MRNSSIVLIFFFQAEDGIRDGRVTGVQTCALPISSRFLPCSLLAAGKRRKSGKRSCARSPESRNSPKRRRRKRSLQKAPRSEERRVGKECRTRGWPYH